MLCNIRFVFFSFLKYDFFNRNNCAKYNIVRMKNEEDNRRIRNFRYNIASHYYFHLEDRESVYRTGSPCIVGRVWHESQLERVDRVDNWKKGRCHRQPFARIYRIRLIKGLFGPFAKNSAITMGAFMNAYVRSNECEKFVAQIED